MLHRGQKKPRTENRDRDRESGPRTETETESQKNREIRDRDRDRDQNFLFFYIKFFSIKLIKLNKTYKKCSALKIVSTLLELHKRRGKILTRKTRGVKQ